ncbi:GGDEF domain-containing protein [Vogesella mureinivorans]|uniref:GGDEF domain-containing protein n=1 Tax=Vogesella mureinivorans TaxID=657276 RepID=UPI0011C815CE|nr:GGDEF domain-containing protein [Vogesella mureinivorans]
MSDPLTIVQANITVCWVAASGWAVAGMVLKMAPVVARRFFLCDFLMGLSLLLTLQRGGALPVWLAYPFADVLGLLAFCSLRLGIRFFVRRDGSGVAESLGVVLLGGALLLGQPYGQPAGFHAVVYSLTAAWLLLRATQDALLHEQQYFTRGARALVASPLAAVGGLFLLRALMVLGGNVATASVASNEPFNVVFLLVGLVLNLAVNIAMAGVVTMRLVGKLEHLSMTDPMTGALNRRAFSASLKQQHSMAQRGMPYALCVLDVDHFKQINDQLGHAAGDAAIVHLVTVLRRELREQDLLCRAGGEEFCILLPDTTEHGASVVANRLRLALEQTPFAWENTRWPLTASFGVAVLSSANDEPETLLQRADRAVYHAKARGRNQVVLL